MTLWRLMMREVLYRKGNFLLGLVALTVAVGSLVGIMSMLRVHEVCTRRIIEQTRTRLEAHMSQLQADMRKATLKLSFNLVILPKDQNLRDWYAQDYASKCMPEAYVTRLADSGIVTARHFLPSLQQKVHWPEKAMDIILVGTRGEVPNLHKNPVKPLVQPVPDGTIVLGHELHQRLGVKTGEAVTLLGRSFTVHKLHAERGNQDDITAWISLREAQELLDKRGLINAILALECLCAGKDGLPKVREEIARILPETQVTEQGSKALARAETRLKSAQEARGVLEQEEQNREQLRRTRERFSAVLAGVVLAACGVWIALLGFINVRKRRAEIGVMRALGLRSTQILLVMLSKSLLMGCIGAVLGVLVGAWLGRYVGFMLEGGSADAMGQGSVRLGDVTFALAVSCLLAVTAGWIPAVRAARQDPAEALAEE